MAAGPAPSALTHCSLAALARSSLRFFTCCPKVSSMSACGSAATALSAVETTSMPISGNFCDSLARYCSVTSGGSVRRMSSRGMDGPGLQRKAPATGSPGLVFSPFAAVPSRSLQALGRVLDQAEVGVSRHVHRRLDEAELMRQVDVGLQRLEVRQHVRVAIVVLLG